MDDSTKVMLPRKLNAENGAKNLLIGEFFEKVKLDCMCVINENPYRDSPCDLCQDTGVYIQEILISWTTIKAIYDKVVAHYGVMVEKKTNER